MKQEKEYNEFMTEYHNKHNTVLALDNVNLDFDDQGLTIILGSSGSGKTTLLRTINGLETSSGGEIYFDNKEVRICCDSGRLFRPVIRVVDNELLLKQHHIDSISLNIANKKDKITTWNEFFNKYGAAPYSNDYNSDKLLEGVDLDTAYAFVNRFGQVYMYNNKAHLNYSFIKPILNKNYLRNRKEQPNVGIVKYTNKTLEALGITPGTLITFTPNSEFEFIIDGERLYCMKSNDIALTHEYKGNEKENNPSWAESS